MNEKGFSLLEGLLALAIVGIVISAVLSAFVGLMDVNTRNEERNGAIAAAQQSIETVRRLDPLTLPTTGSVGPGYVTIGGREFETLTRYCVNTTYCSTNSRHVVIEVSYGGETIYSTESVFTKLR